MANETTNVTVPDESPRRMTVREWMLEVVGGPDKGRSASTLEGLLRVGSGTTNDLVLTDGTVSRRHLEIERTERGLLVKDLGSRNGTYVDGRQVMSAFVEPGEQVTLGKTKLLVKQKSKSTEIQLMVGEAFGEMVGTSRSMRAVFAELARLAKEDMTVLIEGETGTGKELAARALHAKSSRRKGPFRVLDCSLMPKEGAEKELFGPEGCFRQAQRGTLFLDEVAELPASVQPKLLRALDSKTIPALAGAPEEAFDGRVVASTARNLDDAVESGAFRKELFFRLAVARVRIPPLRTRKEDLPVIAERLASGLSTSIELSPQALSMLEMYDWPGNVRELRNVLERGALMQASGTANWLELLVAPAKEKGSKPIVQIVTALPYHEAKDRVVGEFEKQYFTEQMRKCEYDLELAAEHTGLSTQSLYRLLKKNGLRMRELKNSAALED